MITLLTSIAAPPTSGRVRPGHAGLRTPPWGLSGTDPPGRPEFPTSYRLSLLDKSPLLPGEPATAVLRRTIVPGTKQEQILLPWNDQKVKAGLTPLEAQYHDDDVVFYLALESGRADADLGPNALLSFKAAQSGKT